MNSFHQVLPLFIQAVSNTILLISVGRTVSISVHLLEVPYATKNKGAYFIIIFFYFLILSVTLDLFICFFSRQATHLLPTTFLVLKLGYCSVRRAQTPCTTPQPPATWQGLQHSCYWLAWVSQFLLLSMPWPASRISQTSYIKQPWSQVNYLVTRVDRKDVSCSLSVEC